MNFIVYRGTRGLTPLQACELVIIDEPNYSHGPGIYFAFEKSYSQQFVGGYEYTKKFAVLGQFSIEVGTILEADEGDEGYRVSPESNLGRLQSLKQKISEEMKKVYNSIGYRTVLQVPGYDDLSPEAKDKILQELMAYNSSLEQSPEIQTIMAQFQELKKQSQAVKNQYESELTQYDAIRDGTRELVVKNPNLPLTLISFDLYTSPALAHQIHQTIKSGDLTVQGIMNIDGSLAEIVSRLLTE